MPCYTSFDSEVNKYFEVFLSIGEFVECDEMLTSPYTGNQFRAIPQSFIAKVKDGGYHSNKSSAGYIIDGDAKTLGSLAERNRHKLGSKIEDDERRIKKQRLKARRETFEKSAEMREKRGMTVGTFVEPTDSRDAPWRSGPVDMDLAKIDSREKMDKWCLDGKKPL